MGENGFTMKFGVCFSQSRALIFQKFSWPVGPNHGEASPWTLTYKPPQYSKEIYGPEKCRCKHSFSCIYVGKMLINIKC